MMTYDIKTPLDLFEQVLLPTYEDFLQNNASSRHALVGILVAYHLFDWATGDEFCDKAFKSHYGHDPKTLMYFQTAKKLANGFKHYKPLPTKLGTRAKTDTQTGFGTPFSDAFVRPLNVEHAGQNVSHDHLLGAMVAFWTDQKEKGKL